MAVALQGGLLGIAKINFDDVQAGIGIDADCGVHDGS
jgi:hypothetical protein